MKKLASSSGVVIYEDGHKLFISKTPATWTTTFLFVTGLLVLILLVNGVLQIFMSSEEKGSAKIGIILTVSGALLSLIFLSVWNFKRRKDTMPLNELEVIAIFDFENNNLLDSRQQILTPLQQAWLARKMQFGSSSPELLIQWNGGSLSLVKGNPFSGGIASVEKSLLSKGLRKR